MIPIELFTIVYYERDEIIYIVSCKGHYDD